MLTPTIPPPPPTELEKKRLATGRAAVTIDVWHDTICPWCRIGVHNLHTALARFEAAPIVVRYKSFLLNPKMPPSGQDLREHLEQKYGAGRAEGMFEHVTAAGARYGVVFDFAKVRFAPDSAPSHALIASAPPHLQHAVVHAVHEAYFAQGLDIGKLDVLAAIGAKAGLPAAAAAAVVADPKAIARVHEVAKSGVMTGVRGVPHFVFGKGQTVNGAQAPIELLSALGKAASRAT